MTHVTFEESFWAKVDFDPHDEERCWPWGAGCSSGYGVFTFKDLAGKQVWAKAHRVAYELEVGELPPHVNGELELDHTCHDPKTCVGGRSCSHRRCCNPAHLRLAARVENSSGSRAAHGKKNSRKTHCSRGHEYTPENISWCGPSKKWRGCKECRRTVYNPRQQLAQQRR